MPKVIYRGPAGQIPSTLNLPIAAALTPGLAVVSDGSQLSAANDASAEVMILGLNLHLGQGVDQAYESGNTAVAHLMESGQLYLVRLAAGTYSMGQALSVGAGGLFEAAGANRPVAYYRGAPGAVAANNLADVAVA